MVRVAQRTKNDPARGVSQGAPWTTLHEEVAEALERLSQLLVTHTSRDVMMAEPGPAAPTIEAAQEAVRFLGQVAAAWADVPDGALPPTGAGFGSAVVVEDVDQAPVTTQGPVLEHHPRFPNRVNAGFMQVLARERWIMSTQSWNACASFFTTSFKGPSFKQPSASKLSSLTLPR